MTATTAAPITSKLPPAMPGLPIVGNTLAFMRSNGLPVDFMIRAAQLYGDVVRLTAAGRKLYLVSHPDLIHEILVKRVTEFHKPVVLSGQKPKSLDRFLGRALLTADYAEWKPQRKLIQPLMHAKHIEGYAGIMAQFGEKLLEMWRGGETRDISEDMTNVTMWIIAETMFGTDISNTPEIEFAGQEAQKVAVADLILPLPEWLTGRRNRKADKVNAILSSLVARFMAERRETGHGDRSDLLSLLMQTTDEDGNPMPDDFVRNNILTLFFAGHETTANTLTWALHYLDLNPQAAEALHAEVDMVLQGRAPTLEDLRNLPYTAMVIKETMRAEPTVSTLSRGLTEDVELDGYRLESGGLVIFSPYMLHHDARWWKNPDVFDPERFSAENEPNIQKFAYLPFGGGPRVCIGVHFAMMEAQILLAMIASRFELTHAPDAKVVPTRQIRATSAKYGMPMQVRARH